MISTRMARFPMYQANASINERRYAYSLCLHVKPATIFVGVVNLAGSMFCMSMALYFLLNNDPMRRDDTAMYGTTILLYPLLATLSAMLIYGVVKSKPSYILPFFAIQFIDYLFTIPHFLANIYTHPMHRYYMNKAREHLDAMETAEKTFFSPHGNITHYNYNHNMMSISSETISTSIMFSLIVILLKTYFLVTVFKCYRYLHLKDFILPFTVNHTSLHTGSTMAPIVVAVGSMPPNYEEATNMTESKPPGYEEAVQLDGVAIDQDNSGVGVSGANSNHTPSGQTKTIAN